jgi:hypothetical protein
MVGLDELQKKAQQAIGGALEPDEEVLVAQDGEHGAIVATNRRILVCKWGLTSGSAFGKQVNTWDLSNVSGIEHRKGMTTESIVVQAAGAAPVTKFGRMDKGSGTVWQAPNAIFVKKKKKKEEDDQDVVGTLRRLVADHQGAGTRAATPSADPVEQVRKFGQLRDEGLITEDEFQAKKRELLGL